MIITTKENFNKFKNCDLFKRFYLFKITNKLHLLRCYGNKKLHPIGYHIPILVYIKDGC